MWPIYCIFTLYLLDVSDGLYAWQPYLPPEKSFIVQHFVRSPHSHRVHRPNSRLRSRLFLVRITTKSIIPRTLFYRIYISKRNNKIYWLNKSRSLPLELRSRWTQVSFDEGKREQKLYRTLVKPKTKHELSCVWCTARRQCVGRHADGHCPRRCSWEIDHGSW